MTSYECYSKLRDDRKLNDFAVSKATNIAPATLSDWKKGKSEPKLDKQLKIAEFFGVSVEYLMTGEDPAIDEQLSALPYDKDQIAQAIEIYRQYRSASPEIRQAIELLLKSPKSDS